MRFILLSRSLKSQVILWITLPITILLVVFSVGGVNGYDNAMRALAIEDEKRLAVALAESISVHVDIFTLRTGTRRSDVTIDMLQIEDILHLYHEDITNAVLLFNSKRQILYGSGSIPDEAHLYQWPGVAEALQGRSGTLVAPDGGYVTAYSPVPNMDWYLIIRESWHSLIDPLIHLDQLMAFVLFAAILISLLTLIFGIRFVARPLRELGSRARRIGQGEFDAAALPVGGVKEIEELRQTLNDMAHQVESYQGSLQDYLRAVTRAQEEERSRLARELHDVTTQTLIALGHRAQMIQRSVGRDIGQTQERISELRQMIAAAIEEVRHFTQALHPPYLEELGLVTGLQILSEEAGTHYMTFGHPCRLSPEKELAIYRIAQEALNNARRHARAQKICVELHYHPAHIRLQVIDDGVGFEMPSYLNSLTRTGHFGLVGMRERAQLVGGRLEINSSPGKGTTISFSLSA